MKISLVVCTKNRAEQLRNCLDYVAKIKCLFEWELIIVNNASTDHTDAVLEEFSEKTSLVFRTIYEPSPGTGFARNTGWRLACGKYVAFIDDDCYPKEDYLTEVINCLDEGPWGFVGGRVLLFDPTYYPITIQTSEARKEYEAFSFIAAGEIHGANFAFRKQALEVVKGFDPRFGAGTAYPCEDVDVLARILGVGWAGIYDPRPVVHHHHRRKSDAVPKLIAAYDRGRGAYYAKCMMNSNLRRRYGFNWLKTIRHQSVVTTQRELVAAVRYSLMWLAIKLKR